MSKCIESTFGSGGLADKQVISAFRFLLRQALAPLKTDSPAGLELRDILLAAGIALIKKHGEASASGDFLLPFSLI